MTDENKITVTAKLAQEVLGAAVDGGLPIVTNNPAASAAAITPGGGPTAKRTAARSKASAVVRDALTIMASPLIRVGVKRSSDDMEDGTGSDMTACMYA